MRALCLLAMFLSGFVATAQAEEAQTEELRAGQGFIETPVFSLEEDLKLLVLYDGLRVADVSDGMDAVGLPNTGLMDSAIHPLWKDTETFSHRFVGIAVTARYVPTNRMPAGKRWTWALSRPAESYSSILWLAIRSAASERPRWR